MGVLTTCRRQVDQAAEEGLAQFQTLLAVTPPDYVRPESGASAVNGSASETKAEQPIADAEPEQPTANAEPEQPQQEGNVNVASEATDANKEEVTE